MRKLTMDDRTVKPGVPSWAKTHESQSSFSHEKTQHVILEEEESHDRTGAILAQAILSQEAYGVLLLPLHSSRIDCYLSRNCVQRSLWKVIRLTDHDVSFVVASPNSDAEFCGSGARVAVTQQ